MDNIDSNPINKTNINDDIPSQTLLTNATIQKNIEIQMKKIYLFKLNCWDSNVIELLQVKC